MVDRNLDTEQAALPLALPLPPRCPQNAASQLNARPCQLVATETAPADGPRLLYILQRWLPMVLHIRRECSAYSCFRLY